MYKWAFLVFYGAYMQPFWGLIFLMAMAAGGLVWYLRMASKDKGGPPAHP